MVNFAKVIRKFDGGYIAVVDKSNAKSEKLQVAQFSKATKKLLGLGAGFLGISSELSPLVNSCDWDEKHLMNYPFPHKLHVFILVLNDEIVGYAPIRWHWNIRQRGELLGADGKPLEADNAPVVVIQTVTEYIEHEPAAEPERLQCWGIEGICIVPKWQRKGLGKLLLRTALKYLGTNEKEVAYDPPLTDQGRYLIKSMGLNPDELRYSPGL